MGILATLTLTWAVAPLAAAKAPEPASGPFLVQAPADVSELIAELGFETAEGLVASFPLAPDNDTDRLLAAIGDELLYQGHLAEAEAIARERLRGRVERYGEDSPQLGVAISNLAWIIFRAGRFEEAVEAYERLLEQSIAHHGEDSLHAVITRVNLASAYQGLGDYTRVETSYTDALEVLRETSGPESEDVATVATNLAVFLYETGRGTEAEALAKESYGIYVELYGANSFQAAKAMQLIANVHEAQWRLDEAELEYRDCLSTTRALVDGDDARLGNAWSALGSVLQAKGDLASAEACWTEALAILERTVGEGHNTAITTRTGLGLVNHEAGRYGRAAEHLERVVDLCADVFGTDHPGYIHRACMLVSAYTYAERFEEAEALCRQLLLEDAELAHAPGHLKLAHADASARLGEVLFAIGELEEAAEAVTLALEIRKTMFGPEHRRISDIYALLAMIREAQGQYELAREAALSSLAIGESLRVRVIGDELARARYAGGLEVPQVTQQLARLAVLSDDPSGAIEYAELGRGRMLIELLSRSETSLLADDPERRGELDALVRAEELARFRLRETEHRSSRSAIGDGPNPSLVEARTGLNQASAAVFAYLRDAWPSAQPLDTQTIQARLAEGELVLSYSWSPWMLSLTTLAKSGAPEAAALTAGFDSTLAFEQRVTAFTAALSRDPRERGSLDRDELAALAETLIPESARERLSSARRVIAIEEGPLRRLPIELLLDAILPPGQVPEVLHAPSVSVHLNRSALAESAPLEHLVALADPSFIELADDASGARAPSMVGWFPGGLKELPASRAEVSRAAELFRASGGQATVLLGERATRSELEAAASGASVLHLATHGVHGTEAQPFDAALALSGGEDAPAEESFLTLDRLVRTWSGRLEGSSLVVLSACDSHREVTAGTDTVSLPWGFFHAGAPTVVATLWKVDDRAAALLTARFYENLFGARAGTEPMTKLRALDEAKSWLAGATRAEIRGAWKALDAGAAARGTRGVDTGAEPASEVSAMGLLPYADPYFWAPFVLLGAPE